MFKIGDIVKRKNNRLDSNQYRIKDAYENIFNDGTKLQLYAIVDVRTNKIQYYGMEDSAMELDKSHYRKLKIDKICSKLGIT